MKHLKFVIAAMFSVLIPAFTMGAGTNTVGGGGGAGQQNYAFDIAPGSNTLTASPGGATGNGDGTTNSYYFNWETKVTENSTSSVTFKFQEVYGGLYQGEGKGFYGPYWLSNSAGTQATMNNFDYCVPIGNSQSQSPNYTLNEGVSPTEPAQAIQYVYTNVTSYSLSTGCSSNQPATNTFLIYPQS